MKVASILLARIGSHRYKEKLLQEFFGRALIEHTLEFMSELKNESYVYSTDERIRKLTEKYRLNYREKAFEGVGANHKHRTVDELLLYNKEVKADVVCLFQATSPFRLKDEFERGLMAVINNEVDCAFSVQKIQRIVYRPDGSMVNESRGYTEQSDFFVETGAYYIFNVRQLKKPHITEGKRLFCLDPFGIDIDTERDLKVAEKAREGYYNDKIIDM